MENGPAKRYGIFAIGNPLNGRLAELTESFAQEDPIWAGNVRLVVIGTTIGKTTARTRGVQHTRVSAETIDGGSARRGITIMKTNPGVKSAESLKVTRSSRAAKCPGHEGPVHEHAPSVSHQIHYVLNILTNQD